MSQSVQTISEAQLLHLARNALLVAGQEMGEGGDHWPVINATIHQLMRDYEALQNERSLHAELKTHLYAKLAEMSRSAHHMPASQRKAVAARLGELQEVCGAFFTEADYQHAVIDDEDLPPHVKRLKYLIETLLADSEDGKKGGDGKSDAEGMLGSVVSGIVRLTAELRARQEALQVFSFNFASLLAKMEQQFGRIVKAAREILAAALPARKEQAVLAVRADRKQTHGNQPKPGMG
jgi:hypothetical protein